tara:strand:+ start:13961 stop:14674 length:714 start_codon:yes stop_codon:yes gene_type:complete
MIELNKIYNEDCLVTMNKLNNQSIDYCITSPPYNIKNKNINKYKEYTDDMSSEDYYNNQKKIINEMLRITKKHIFYNIQMVSGNKFVLHRLIGFFYKKIKEILIWKKQGQPAISKNVFNSAFEYIIIFSNKSPDKRYFNDANFKRGTQNNIFNIKNSHFNQYSDIHKAVFPLDLPRFFMINFGNKKDIWYDPYMGTGTSAVASIKENKTYLGSEIYKEYVDISEKRLLPYKQQKTLF